MGIYYKNKKYCKNMLSYVPKRFPKTKLLYWVNKPFLVLWMYKMHGGITMKIGYARVSTQDQSLDRQIDSLKAVNCQKIYQEKITDRPELDKLLENLRPGDIIIKSELTRLSWSTKDLFLLVEAIYNKGADIKSLKELWLDTTTPTGKLMFTIMAGISQFERDLINQRTKEGLESARVRGRKVEDQHRIIKSLN
jgi:DNA invertase Pin-like site-specific DNA recombinase